MHRRPCFRFSMTVPALLAIVLTACQPIQPIAIVQEDVSHTLVIEMTADGLNAPEEMPSGIVAVTFKNNSDTNSSPGFAWMHEGHTIADFEEAIQAEDFLTMLSMSSMVDTVELAPGESKESIYDIKAGEILVANFPDDGPPQLKLSKATAPSTLAAPVADYVVELADFAFIMPDEIAAGSHLWEVRNTGKQHHEIIIVKLNEGVTIEDLINLAAADEPPQEPPFEEIAFGSFMGSNMTSWVTLDIPAGEYTVLCFLPNTDAEAMTPHLAHGMVRTLVVK